MSTPKTKPPVRWKQSTKHHPGAEGGAMWGITDTSIAASYGLLVSYWWHVEETMIFVFEDLLEGRRNESFSSNSPARSIFRTIIAQEARMKVMQALLEGMPHNAHLPEVYDDILKRFRTLNKERNNLVHGIWVTERSTGKVMVRESSNTPKEYCPPRHITKAYLDGLIKQMRALFELATLRGGEPIASRGTSLPPRD